MISAQYCQLLARYNRWMNERMLAAAAALDDAERKRDRGAFFGSLQRTLSHLLWADRTWLCRFTGHDYGVPGYGADLFDDFLVLARERALTDERISEYCATLDDAVLATTFAYRNTAGSARSAPLWVTLAHYFNHQTHHRGQALTLLKQAGKDIGATDLVAMPGVVRIES
ncbi:MAG: DinB family protein [Casimicrobiaceae bacterium]